MAIRVIEGQNYLPEKITWDGKSQSGIAVVSGSYLANLRIKYQNGTVFQTKSNFIEIDKFDPFVTISTNKRFFSPDEDGLLDSLQISVDISDETDIQKYELKILNEKNKVVRSFKRIGSPPTVFYWNGVLDTGEVVSSFEKYFIFLQVTDMAGNTGRSNVLSVQTGLCVNSVKQKMVLGKPELILRFSNIEFGLGSNIPNKSAILILSKVVLFLRNHRDLLVTVYGHTDDVGVRNENISLSQKRAEFVKRYLYDNLAEKSIIIKAVGKGPDEPVYENTNDVFRAKNRRVEFKIEKQYERKRK